MIELKKPITNKGLKPLDGYAGGLPDEMIQLLNDQIQVEAFSSQIYLQMAAWCDPQGLTGAAKFYRYHAEEERKHMLKLYEFLADKNIVATTPLLDSPQASYTDLMEVINTTVTHEFYVTSTYEKACKTAFNAGSQQVYQLMQWYIKEQIEEESLFQTILDKANILSKGGMTGLALIELDNMLGDLV